MSDSEQLHTEKELWTPPTNQQENDIGMRAVETGLPVKGVYSADGMTVIFDPTTSELPAPQEPPAQ